MNYPLVSIIIPFYNSSDLLIEMIDSIIVQTYNDWELILIDDCSDEKHVVKIKEYISDFEKILFLSSKGLGKGSQFCRNLGFKKSRGDYIVFFDADDLVSKNCLHQRVNAMVKNTNLDFAVFPAHSFTGDLYDLKNKVNIIYGKNYKTEALELLLKARAPFAVWTNIYKRESIASLVWDENILIFQDFHFNFITILNNLNFEIYSDLDFDYFYRMDNNGITKDFTSSEKLKSTLYLFEYVLRELVMFDDYLTRKKQFFHFVLMYFERLIIAGKTEGAIKLIGLVKMFYPKTYYIKLNLLKTLSSLSESLKLKKGITFALSWVLFGSDSYNQIVQWISYKLKSCRKYYFT